MSHGQNDKNHKPAGCYRCSELSRGLIVNSDGHILPWCGACLDFHETFYDTFGKEKREKILAGEND